jgi:hypothetical protein
VPYFMVLSQHLPLWTEENPRNLRIAGVQADYEAGELTT